MLPKTDEQATDSATALRAVAWQQLPFKVRLHCNRQQRPWGSCKDQVLGNRHHPAVYTSSRAATFCVTQCEVDLTSITARTLHDPDQEVVQLELWCECIDMC